MLLRIIHFCFKQYFKTVIVKKAISYKSEFGEEKKSKQSNTWQGMQGNVSLMLVSETFLFFFKKRNQI